MVCVSVVRKYTYVCDVRVYVLYGCVYTTCFFLCLCLCVYVCILSNLNINRRPCMVKTHSSLIYTRLVYIEWIYKQCNNAHILVFVCILCRYRRNIYIYPSHLISIYLYIFVERYQESHSPYYKESHLRVRVAMRKFCEEELMPFCHEWEEAKKLPNHIYKRSAQAGWLPCMIGPPWVCLYDIYVHTNEHAYEHKSL